MISRKEVSFAKLVIFAMLTLILLNALGALHSLPKAYATTYYCYSSHQSQNGKASGYYYVWASGATNPYSNEYGAYGELQATSWNYDGDTSGHENLMVNLAFGSSGWVQSGVLAGKFHAYSYSSTRYPYIEWSYPTGSGDWLGTSYPISGTDLIYAEDYVESYSGGNYYYELYVYSTNYATAWYTTVNFGSTLYLGDPTTAGETYYTQTSETCDDYANYSSSLAYSSAISSSPSWTTWSSSNVAYDDINYTYYTNSVSSYIFCSQADANYCS